MSLSFQYNEINPLKEALRRSYTAFICVGIFSCAINLLMLTGPLFMLQVYDRVLVSRSVPTLVALFGLVALLFIFLGLFDFIRMRVLSRIGYRLDIKLMELANKVWVFSGLIPGKMKARPANDLTSLRQFLCSSGLPALFDLPWVPLYLAIVYLLHFWLGLLATVGALIIIIATFINEWITKNPIVYASSWELQDAQFAEGSRRNAEAIIAMGMVGRVSEYWCGLRCKSLKYSQLAGARTELITAFSKSIRMLIQSGILALGAYLAIHQKISPGTMIAASILAGRALAPIDLAIGNWKNFIRARQAFNRLSLMFSQDRDKGKIVHLPKPKGNISVSNVFKMAGEGNDGRPILQAIHFELEPGDGLGVIGPSASGKTSLARLLVGLSMPDKGAVRLDGATYDQWDRDEVGQYIGYLPQSVELIAGTVRQNITRFDDNIDDDTIIAAAQLAGVHDLILTFPDGYSTDLSLGSFVLSGGQAQRVALARALLRCPPFVILDEPNANLDAEGEMALAKAILHLRQKGSCVIVMAHRPSAIAAVNKILVLNHGQQVEFGVKESVLRKVTKAVPHSATFRENEGNVNYEK